MSEKPISKGKRSVVITGASRGIGRALAHLHAAHGFDVLAVARNFKDFPHHPNITCLPLDLTWSDAIPKIIGCLNATARPFERLINNAGIQVELDLTRDVGDETPALIDREIALNLTLPIHLSHAMVPLMARPGGTIVNVTSLTSRQPKSSAPVYSATKAGLASFTSALRHQLAPLGIRVVEAVPPLVDTDMTLGRGSGKLSAEAMAQAIYDGIAAQRRIIAPGLSRPVLLLNRLLPELVAKILAKS
ncbi:SDR family NAD(P)-dependent oxidoreductase [Thalassovita sp.]|uniref:SDR family NAD(P)-dependent oxidoreductase n=1 Tax=Thalassovita sp. TaxID=1979401 RepID=UPI002B2797A4|nr:SDR family NAD(P)-dependent oxidoreductase [Thalassovita sp.]